MQSADGQTVSINSDLRQRVVFARHDILNDPPFSRMDLIICRNVLIYFEPQAQDKCISLFHYALKDGGYLFLGNAESIGNSRALFEPWVTKKLYLQKNKGRFPFQKTNARSIFHGTGRTRQSPAKYIRTKQVDHGAAQRALIDECDMSAVAINTTTKYFTSVVQ